MPATIPRFKVGDTVQVTSTRFGNIIGKVLRVSTDAPVIWYRIEGIPGYWVAEDNITAP